jgi:hypothetical protein
MPVIAYRYRFHGLPAAEAEDTLVLAIIAAEALRGESLVRLDARHWFDAKAGACVIDAATRVGRDLNRLFVGLLRHEFGADAFRVDRVGADPGAARVPADATARGRPRGRKCRA